MPQEHPMKCNKVIILANENITELTLGVRNSLDVTNSMILDYFSILSVFNMTKILKTLNALL